MKRRPFLSTLGAAALVTVSQPAAAVITQRTQTKQELDWDTLLALTEVPGIAVAGSIDGNPFQRFAGVRAVTDKIAVTSDTRFSAASLSKPVFAWAVRDLVKQGKLEWSKPLQDYTDLGLTGDAKRITAEHVLSHSTGLPNWRFQADRELATAFIPGSKWQYSGEGFFLLQRVVEHVVGVPIATHMRQSVLSPFGMTASSYAWTPEMQTNAAVGHDRRGAALERSTAFYEKRNYDLIQKAGLQPQSASYSQIAAAYEKAKAPLLPVAMSPNMAGSLWTTAPDYLKFLKRVLADIAERPEDYRARVNVNPKIGWALGWGVDFGWGAGHGGGVSRSVRRSAFFHWGDGPGFKTFAWLQPERKTALVLFTNGDHGLQLYSFVFRKLLSEDPAALSWL